MDMADTSKSSNKRFRVAFSFAGKKRSFVAKVAATTAANQELADAKRAILGK